MKALSAQCIVSSVGTSLLTNGAAPELSRILRDSANHSEQSLSDDVRQTIATRIAEVRQTLTTGTIATRKRLSAELNGVYSLYGDRPALGKNDVHWLLATDTYQGRATAEMVQAILNSDGIANVNILVPPRLSTASQAGFASGIRETVTFCEETLIGYRESGYRVLFNLVGGFKSLQGYLNTIGMFYADEIVYIFEGPGSPLLRIPRLPIRLDENLLEQHSALCARMAEEYAVPRELLADWPEMLWQEEADGRAWFSTWGLLLWERTRDRLLGERLLEFPGLRITPRFQRDFDNHPDRRERVLLQEKLARVSVLLEQNNGNTNALRQDGGLLYDNYTNIHPPIGHFRVNLSLRVNCRLEGTELVLLRFGGHEIERDPEA